MRYVISVDVHGTKGEDGPLICSPSGGCLVYDELQEACDAAKTIVKHGTVKDAYVHKLVCTAAYVGMNRDAVTDEQEALPLLEPGDSPENPNPEPKESN